MWPTLLLLAQETHSSPLTQKAISVITLPEKPFVDTSCNALRTKISVHFQVTMASYRGMCAAHIKGTFSSDYHWPLPIETTVNMAWICSPSEMVPGQLHTVSLECSFVEKSALPPSECHTTDDKFAKVEKRVLFRIHTSFYNMKREMVENFEAFQCKEQQNVCRRVLSIWACAR